MTKENGIDEQTRVNPCRLQKRNNELGATERVKETLGHTQKIAKAIALT